MAKAEYYMRNFYTEVWFYPELRIPLERLAQKLGDDNDILTTLAGHLREFTQESQTYKKRQNLITVVSLI